MADLEEMTPDNPPPPIDDAAVPVFADKPKPNFAQARKAFFDDSHPEDHDGEQTPDAAVHDDDSDRQNPARQRLAKLGTAAETDPTAAALLEQGAGEDAGDAGEADTPPADPAAPPAAGVVEEFRTADGHRYRARTADGKLVDPLQALQGATIEVFENGEFKAITADKLPIYLANAHRFNREQHNIAAERRQMQAAAQELQAREAEVQRFFTDPEYRAKVEEQLARLETPEGQLEVERARNHQHVTREEHNDLIVASQLVEQQVVMPALEAIQKQHPTLAPEDVGEMYQAAMVQFAPGDLKMVRGRDGNFYPVNPAAWDRFTQLMNTDLPQRAAAKVQRLAAQIGTAKDAAVADRKTKAEKEAETVRRELARNAAAGKSGTSPGLPPGREKPKQPIRTIQQGRKWLTDD